MSITGTVCKGSAAAIFVCPCWHELNKPTQKNALDRVSIQGNDGFTAE